VQFYRALVDRWQLVHALGDAADVHLLAGDHTEAALLMIEALRLSAGIGDPEQATWALLTAAQLLRLRGQDADAAQAIEYALRTRAHSAEDIDEILRHIAPDLAALSVRPRPPMAAVETLPEQLAWAAGRLQADPG